VREPTTTHRLSVAQLQRWCDSVTPNPAETIKKTKLEQMLKA
jgi:hypothetical protein